MYECLVYHVCSHKIRKIKPKPGKTGHRNRNGTERSGETDNQGAEGEWVVVRRE